MAFIADAAEGDELTNWERVLARRPEIDAAWRQLVRSISGNMDVRTYELATLAAARRLRSSYCSLAHGTVLAEKVFDWDTVRDIAAGETGPLDERDRAVMAFAEKIVDDASSVTQSDVDGLRALGLSEEDVVDVAAAAAARCFFSKLLDSLGIEPDASYAALDPSLREALVVGRPIASS
jgi:uncharacterized peroxidase-related enzyme